MKRMAVKIFVDFDGTITTRDVGNTLFREFGGATCDAITAEFREEKISARVQFLREAAAAGDILRADMDALLDRQTIDPGFKEFVNFCRDRQIDFHIVSDGLDYYIDRVLRTHDIRDVSFVSNVLSFEPAGVDGRVRMALDFPHSDSVCDRCACCKRNFMLTHAGEDDIIVLIGEGYSDQCPAQYADIVFAKDKLQTYCQRENISYYLYASFHDVTERLTELLSRRQLRKRRRAELKRKEAFLRES
jgi:2-hydroxy-3-keto-5-methylthiopentenyl-1-phosphate phosphatase